MLIVDHQTHLDHGLTMAQLAFVLKELKDTSTFKIVTLDLPRELGTVECALYGPAMGDEPVTEDQVHYAKRGDRAECSRLVNLLPRQTSKLTAICVPDHENYAEGVIVLATTYGGPAAPREPFDVPAEQTEARAEAEKFWQEHALSA